MSRTRRSGLVMTKLELFVLIVSCLLANKVTAQCVSTCDCAPTGVCCLQVYESLPPHTEVGKDSSITGTRYIWTMTSQSNGIFNINETTGVITTRVVIDREGVYPDRSITNGQQSLRENNYCFSLVFQSDSTLIRVNIQVLDVNDNPPIFTLSSYLITIKESKGNNTVPDMCSGKDVLNLTAIDKDDEQNANTTYRVEGDPRFELADNSIPCVQTKPGVELDRDTDPSSYSFILVAQDIANQSLRSETNVTYVLLDINDNRPIFENPNMIISIKENLTLGAIIHQFQAHDMDSGTNGEAGLVYSYEENMGSSTFMINETNGVLTLAQEVDAETRSNYILTVSATDMRGTPQNLEIPLVGTARVEISVEDINEPALISFQPTEDVVEEGEYRLRQIAAMVVNDGDRDSVNKMNTLRVTSSQDDVISFKRIETPPFVRYFLNLDGTVDYETNKVINLVLNLTEEGNPVLYQIRHYNVTVMDVNDNRPSLNRTIFSVPEEEDAIIVNLGNYTYDPDNGNNGTVAKYELFSVIDQGGQDLTDVFRSQLSESGLLTAETNTIDREEVGNILNFVVNITDAGKPPLWELNNFIVKVTDKNDNSPTFEMSSYEFELYEGEEVGTSVGLVVATDPDSGENRAVNFAIEPPSRYFAINGTTGVISSKQEFDRESNTGKYTINVTATDRGSTSMSSGSVVTVLIIDINDNSPIFDRDMITFNIDTNFGPGKQIGEVVATDEDSSLNNNNLTWYQLEKGPFSSMFSISNNISGIITLEATLTEEGTYPLNVSAFNPGEEESGDSILVNVSVSQATFYNVTVTGIAVGCGILLMLIVITGVLVICFCLKNRKSKRQYKMNEEHLKLNNTQNSILKIPVVNGTAGRSGRVTFKERVEETHYDEESVINGTKNTVKKESITKFDNSPRVPHPFVSSECTTPSPSSSTSSSSSGQHGQPDGIAVVDLEMSPRHVMNGDINGHCQYDVHSHSHPHSPIIRIANTSSRGHGGEMIDYSHSQGTSSDGHTSNNDLDDEESLYSDDDSIVNTALSRFSNNRPDLGMPYETPSTHSHLELHRHLPPISHGQHTHSSSLAQLHAHNLAQLAKESSNGTRPQYSSILSPEREHSLTPTHDPLQHISISTQSSTHSPPGAINHMGVSSSSKRHLLGGGRNYPHPLVMPDAFPRDAPDVHRFPIDSYTDYGEASTYASTELDEALGFNLDAEPGIISLTATDYEDTEL